MTAVLLGSSALGLAQTISAMPHAQAGSHGAHPHVASAGGDITSINTPLNLTTPTGIAVDAHLNVYVADQQNARVIMVSADGTTITTVAGQIGNPGYNGDGIAATSAQLFQPTGLAFDANGNLYIADRLNNRIRMVNASSQVITTVAGNGTAGSLGDAGPATSAELNSPTGVAFDGSGNLYIADSANATVREVAAVNGAITSNSTITTVAGTPGSQGYSGDGGSALSAELGTPFSVAIDANGVLYISDPSFPSVRKVAGGTITTVAGNGSFSGYTGEGGPAASATLYPFGLAVDGAGDLYIACGNNHENNRIVKISGGVIATVAGNGTAGMSGVPGVATQASLNNPEGIGLDSAGNLYIADTGNDAAEKVTFSGASKPTVTVTPSNLNVTTAESFDVSITVSGGADTQVATGSVTLTGGSYTSPATTLSNGAATITVNPGTLAPGSYELTVNYTPDSASSSVYTSATGTSATVNVEGAMPNVVVTTSAPSITTTQPLTVTIAVSATNGSPAPTGSVSLSSGSYASAPVVLNAGSATIQIPGGSLAAGTDTLTVTYTPDTPSSAIYSLTSVNVTQVVTSASNFTPTVTVQPSAANITTAQVLTVNVSVSTASGKPAPTGMVTLTSGSFAPPSLTLVGGSASFQISPGALPVGTDTITVAYAPDAASASIYNSASGTATVAVVLPAKIVPTVLVKPSATAITVSQGLSIAIAVQGGSGNAAPTGSVTLSGGGYSTSAPIPLENSMATVTIPYGVLSPGNDTFTVTYTPDTNSAITYATATGTAVVVVSAIQASTPAVTIVANPPVPNTAESVIIAVSLSGTPAPTGSIVLSSGSYTSSTATLSVGKASFTIPAGILPPGADTVVATYTPDSESSTVYNPASGSITLSVAPGGSFTVSNSQTSLTISPGGTSGNTATISVTPASGFTGQINLGCSVTTSLSIYTDAVTCTLGSSGSTKTSLMLNGAPASTTLTVLSTAAGSTATTALRRVFGGGAMLGALLFCGGTKRRRGVSAILVLILSAIFGLALGCGSNSSGGGKNNVNPGTTAGPYIVTVTATDAATGTLTSTNTLNVIVN